MGYKSGDAFEGLSPIFPAGRQRTACTARVSHFATAATGLLASCGGFGVLPGQDAKRPGMGPAVVLGQDLAEGTEATVPWQIRQRVTGRWVTVTGKRRDCEMLINAHDARSAAMTAPLCNAHAMRHDRAFALAQYVAARELRS